jgi:hypothetical protein
MNPVSLLPHLVLYGIGKGGRSLLGPVEKRKVTATAEV